MPTLILAAAAMSSSSLQEPAGDISLQQLDTTVNQVSNLAKTINEYGPLIVALALIMVLLIIVMGYMLYRTNKTINELHQANKEDEEKKNEQMDRLLDHLLNGSNLADQIAEKVSDHVAAHESPQHKEEPQQNEKKDLVGMYIDVNMAFKSASRVAISKLHCSRVAIYVFHNGNKSLHGLPFFKMSCVHEWTIRGSKTVRGKTHYDMPLHMYSDIVETLATDNQFVVSDVKAEAIETESLMDFIMPSEVKSFYMLGITDQDGVLAGFSIAEYNKAVDFTDLDVFTSTEQTLKDLNDTVKEIVLHDSFISGFNKH